MSKVQEPEEVICFRDACGGLHDTLQAAQHRNKRVALAEFILMNMRDEDQEVENFIWNKWLTLLEIMS